MNWLYNKDGHVHRALACCSEAEIDVLAQRDAAAEVRCGPLELVMPGDVVRVAPKYSIGQPTGGWLRVVRVSRAAVNGPSILVTGPAGGGFISPEMIVEWRRGP